MANNFCSSLQF